MNLLARAKLSAHLIFSSSSSSSSSSSGKRLFYLHSVAALQQCNSYSTKTAQTGPKGQQLTKPRTKKSSESSPSSSGFSQRIKKQIESVTTVWPRPSEIPYQAKVSNFVNLIGNVKIPVRFESGSDGKHLATTVISLGNEGETNSLSMPVVFEGDLAHVVACHVKQDDCVFVSGQLSVAPMGLVLSESLGKFHVVAENLNFVQGFDKSALDKKMGILVSDVETDKLGEHESSSIESPAKPFSIAESEPQSESLEHGNVESSPEKGSNKSGESVSKIKDTDQISDLWKNLVKNPLQWWDYRNHKASGLVKEKFPDFKQKGTGESLWISSAPKWLLPGLGKLEFDVKDFKSKQVQGGGGPIERNQNGQPIERNQNGQLEDSWKNLVENPEKWWDNRAMKRNSKSPDFRHKETGEALWLNRSPVWALSRIPPMKGGQNTS